jgi:sugar phosphate isomerase/epimerase
MKPISIQLYSLRERTEKDFVGVLQGVAEMGYKGVEPAGLFGLQPEEVRRIVEDLGMAISSNHGPRATPDNVNEIIDVAGGLGTDLVVCGWGPDDFKDMAAMERTAEAANFMVDSLTGAGVSVALHNHWWEFGELGGRLIYEVFLEMCPGLYCEIDTYWAANFGALDPAEQVAKFKHRTPLLHIKDGPLVKGEAHVAVGSGKMDIPAVIAAADEDVLQWLVVELDECDTDMTTAVAESCAYLSSEGLGAGNK